MLQLKKKYEAVVIGVSAGGMRALKTILPELPKDFSQPIIVVQHLKDDQDDYFVKYLDQLSDINVSEAQDKEPIECSHVYIAPANYHLLVEEDKTFSLSMDEPINFSRPSIDVLFDSASRSYEEKLIGVILTGASRDGSQGLKKIKERGGYTIAQDPSTAKSPLMPQEAIAATKVDQVLHLEEIGSCLISLSQSE